MTYVITVTHFNGNRAQWIEKQWTNAILILRQQIKKYPKAEIQMQYFPKSDEHE